MLSAIEDRGRSKDVTIGRAAKLFPDPVQFGEFGPVPGRPRVIFLLGLKAGDLILRGPYLIHCPEELAGIRRRLGYPIPPQQATRLSCRVYRVLRQRECLRSPYSSSIVSFWPTIAGLVFCWRGLCRAVQPRAQTRHSIRFKRAQKLANGLINFSSYFLLDQRDDLAPLDL